MRDLRLFNETVLYMPRGRPIRTPLPDGNRENKRNIGRQVLGPFDATSHTRETTFEDKRADSSQSAKHRVSSIPCMVDLPAKSFNWFVDSVCMKEIDYDKDSW